MNNRFSNNNNSRQKKSEFVPGEVRENSPETIQNEQKFIGWVDATFKSAEEKGTFDDLPGKGKPLNLKKQGDVLSDIMKEANYKPRWVEQQQEIKKAIERFIYRRDHNVSINVEEEISNINEKIRAYNRTCPNPMLQRGLVSAESIDKQYERWQ